MPQIPKFLKTKTRDHGIMTMLNTLEPQGVYARAVQSGQFTEAQLDEYCRNQRDEFNQALKAHKLTEEEFYAYWDEYLTGWQARALEAETQIGKRP